MKVTGIIAEYNPLHNGHQFHIEQARKLTGSDYVAVIMSGDYTQRGTPAIFSKYMRTRSALLAGADLVLEMPVFGSVSSAPDFSDCGVSILNATGVCDYLCFGSESGNIDDLAFHADALDTESAETSEKLRQGLKSGLTWPEARAAAYEESASIPSSPNDILSIEYMKSIKRLNSSMEPVTIKRTDPGYHSVNAEGQFASATAARKAILDQDLSFLTQVMPDSFFSCLEQESCPPLTWDDFSILLNDRILRTSLDDMMETASMPSDLARKLYKEKRNFLPASALVAERKDRQYTYTRVNRCLLNLMLNITKSDTELFKSFQSAPWIRILGFRKEASDLLSAMKKNASAPIITKTAAADSLLPDTAKSLFEKHVQCADIYRMVQELKTGHSVRNEYTRSVLIL